LIKRADSAPVAVPFQVTPMLLTALVGAVLSTVLLAVLWYVDAHPGPPPPPLRDFGRPPPPPPGSRAALAMAVGVFAIAWVSVIVVACRDQILRRIDHAAERFEAATLEFAEQREQEGIFRGMHMATPTDPGSGGSGPGGGGSGGGGSGGGAHVVPFPRPSPPQATSDD
jgi:uncharacterized membrane protein YgcG